MIDPFVHDSAPRMAVDQHPYRTGSVPPPSGTRDKDMTSSPIPTGSFPVWKGGSMFVEHFVIERDRPFVEPWWRALLRLFIDA